MQKGIIKRGIEMIAEFEARILALIDDMVEHASDDELFASGYLLSLIHI